MNINVKQESAIDNGPEKKRMLHKIIGVFQEIDGDEIENFTSMKEELKLIGSTSEDVGNLHLYYDTNGNTYVIAHDSAYYYGDKAKTEIFSFINKKSKEVSQYTNLDEMLKSVLTSVLADYNPDISNISYKQKIAIIREHGYSILSEVY